MPGINKLCPKCGQAMPSFGGHWHCIPCKQQIPWPRIDAVGNTQGLENE